MASECGFASCYGESQIVIISRDAGFLSIADYFALRSTEFNTRIITASTIENGLKQLTNPEDLSRSKSIISNSTMVDLNTATEEYNSMNAVRVKIQNAFYGTEHEPNLSDIIEWFCTDPNRTSKKLYTEALHSFGRNTGTSIYRIIKKVI